MRRAIYLLPLVIILFLGALFFATPTPSSSNHEQNLGIQKDPKAPLTKTRTMLFGLSGKKEIWVGKQNDHTHCLFNFKSASLFNSNGRLVQDIQDIDGYVEALSNTKKWQTYCLKAPFGRCDMNSTSMQMPSAHISIFESLYNHAFPPPETKENNKAHLLAEGDSKALTFSLDKGLNLTTSRIQANLFSDP